MPVYKKILTFSLIGILFLGQTFPVLAEEASVSGEIATQSSQLESDRKLNSGEILDLIKDLKEENNSSIEIATESAQATDSANLLPPDFSILETIPSAQLKKKIKRPSLVKSNLAAREKMEINLGDYEAQELQVFVYDSSGKEIELNNVQLENDQINFELPKAFRPGHYHLKVINDSPEVLIEQDFTWGVLAINPNKSIYFPEENVHLAMAVLNEQGAMVCDAIVSLKIIDPEGQVKELSTEQKTISVNQECLLHNYTEKPDYEASYQANKVGVYQMELTAETRNGKFIINDSFEVKEQIDFDIERSGPTRIYPPAVYTVDFDILADKDFEGVIEETVPSSFEILPLSEDQEVGQDLSLMNLEQIAAQFDNGEVLGASINRSYDDLEAKKDSQIIRWYINLKKGEEIKLGYRFDAPDISPQFYLLGPLKFIDANQQAIFQETRLWQIASDASPREYTSGSGNFTAEWTGNHTIILIGGGGGGADGNSTTNKRGGGGGGGGACLVKVVSLTKDSTYAYSVGTAGNAGVDANGGDGGSTTFTVGATTYTAGGGKGGAMPTTYTGGAGGTASGGDSNYTGGKGGDGTASSGSGGGGSAAGTTGNGNAGSVPTAGVAKSLYGGAGGDGTTANTGAGTAATDPYGGGGGGGTKGASGAAGMSGYIRIEWTLPTITVSGTSNLADSTTVRVAVNGSLSGQTGTVSSGSWQITGVTQPNTNEIMTVFATDGDGDIADTSESTAIGKYSGSGNMTDMVLNTNVLSVGGTGAQSISLSDLVTANYDSDQDEDIMYDAETASLLVEAAVNSYTAEKMDVLTTDTFTLSNSASLTTYDMTITGALVSGTSSTFNVSHNWSNNGTFTESTSTVVLNGSTAQTINGTSSTAFYNLTDSNTSAAVAVSTNMSIDSSGTLNMNGANTILNPGASIIVSGSGTLTGTGTVNVTRTSVTADFSSQYTITNKTLTNLTVNYTGTGQVLSDLTYGNLTISGTNCITTGTNTATVGGAFTVSSTFTPSGGTMTFNNNASIVNSGTLTFQNISIAASATVTTTASFNITATLTIGSSGNFSPGVGSTITMSNAAWAISNSAGTLVFKGLTIDATPSTQPTHNFSISGTLTINSGKTLAPTSGTITMTGGSIVNSGGATTNLVFNNLTVTGTTTTSSDFTVNGTLNVSGGNLSPSGGTITMATVNSTITNSGTLTFRGLTINETPTAQSQYNASFGIDGALTIAASKTFAPTGGTITRGVSSNGWSTTINSGASLTYYSVTYHTTPSAQSSASFSVANALTVDSGVTLAPSGGTITMTGGSIVNNGGATTNLVFNNLTVTGTTTTSSDFTVNGTLNVNGGNLSPSGGTITMATNSWVITNSGTLVFKGLTISETPSVSGQPTSSFSVGGTLTVNNSKILAPTSGIITMTGTGWAVSNSGTLTFSGLTIDGTPGTQPTASFSISGALIVNSGKTLAPTSGTITMTGGSITNNGGSTTNLAFNNLTVTGTTTTSSDFNVNGTLNVNGGNLSPSSGTITMSGTSSSISNSGTLVFNNFAVGNGASAATSNSFSLIGNFANSGVFTASAGTVTFSGGDGSTQQISGDSTFYDFTASTVGVGSTGRTLQFAGGSSIYIYGAWTVTGESGKVITLQSSNETNWTIIPGGTANVTYVDVYRSTNNGIYFCATYSTKDVNTLDWSVSDGDSCNQAPNSPSSLAQKKTDDTVLTVGAWTSESTVKFTATADDSDSSDTLYLCVEKDDINTAFADSEDFCGPGVAFSGAPVSVGVTVPGITDATQYHWHARVKDAASAYSSWVAYGDNPTGDGSTDGSPANRDFGVDTTAPTGGTVYDGTTIGVDGDFNGGSLSGLSANWADINSDASGLNYYEYSIGTSIGGTEVGAWVNVGTGTTATVTGLNLQTSAPYYFNVRATDNAGNTQSAISSDGQVVTPSLSFTVSPGSLTFDNLNAGNSFTDNKPTTLTTSTNAYGGYVIRAFITGLLTAPNPSYSIINFNGANYTSPDEWLIEDRGFGYNSSDTTILGVNKFNNNPCPGGGTPPCYAPFSLSAPGDIVADHTDNVTGAPISNEEFTITNKVKINGNQEAFPYSTTVVYTATAYY